MQFLEGFTQELEKEAERIRTNIPRSEFSKWKKDMIRSEERARIGDALIRGGLATSGAAAGGLGGHAAGRLIAKAMTKSPSAPLRYIGSTAGLFGGLATGSEMGRIMAARRFRGRKKRYGRKLIGLAKQYQIAN